MSETKLLLFYSWSHQHNLKMFPPKTKPPYLYHRTYLPTLHIVSAIYLNTPLLSDIENTCHPKQYIYKWICHVPRNKRKIKPFLGKRDMSRNPLTNIWLVVPMRCYSFCNDHHGCDLFGLRSETKLQTLSKINH